MTVYYQLYDKNQVYVKTIESNDHDDEGHVDFPFALQDDDKRYEFWHRSNGGDFCYKERLHFGVTNFTDAELAKLRKLLISYFPWLDTDEVANGADTVDDLVHLFEACPMEDTEALDGL